MVNIFVDDDRPRAEDRLMYGKHFASMYGGSMYGKPAMVFAVWGYIISHFRPSRKDGQCYVNLNPALLAGIFSTTPEQILDALAVLEAPDKASQSKLHDGRRIVLLSDERLVGPLEYLVVNGAKYRAIRDEEDRREYLKEAKRLSRARNKADSSTLSTMSTTVNHGPPPSTQAEAESEARSEQSAYADAPAVIAYLNAAAGRRYRTDNASSLAFVRARMREGATLADFMAVIDAKCREWLGTEQAQYLRPETLFNATKFESYRGALGPAAGSTSAPVVCTPDCPIASCGHPQGKHGPSGCAITECECKETY